MSVNRTLTGELILSHAIEVAKLYLRTHENERRAFQASVRMQELCAVYEAYEGFYCACVAFDHAFDKLTRETNVAS